MWLMPPAQSLLPVTSPPREMMPQPMSELILTKTWLSGAAALLLQCSLGAGRAAERTLE